MISRKHHLLYTISLLLLLLTACGEATNTPTPSPTATPVPTATATPVPLAVNTSVPTPSPTPTATYTPTPSPTNTPTPTPSPTPTATCTPTPSPTNTPTPTPTPTATCTPTPSPTNTPAPTPTPALIIPEGFPDLIYKNNTILEEPVLTSEEEVNRKLFQMALGGYYKFGLLAEDISMLHTPEEYLELFPEILSIEAESLTKYHNGYYLRFSDMKSTQTDLAVRYALRTGDTSFLTDNELLAYQKLFTIAEELRLQELSDIEAVIAVHDYLVINTTYDEVTAASASGGPSHYMEGTLLNKTAVCSGYASTFQLLMIIAGVPCEYVWNDVHAWNLVQVENEWYHLDVTWDDPINNHPNLINYTYFMMTDEEVSELKDHTSWICECGNPHDCDDSSYRLYPYADVICSSEEEATSLILNQATEDIITLVYPSDGILTEESLLSLAYHTLSLSGNITYYPAKALGDNHQLLHIIIN